MTEFMLDTDAVSHWLRGAGGVGARLRRCAPSDVCISAITAQELELGVARKRSKRLRQSVDAFYREITIAAYDEAAAKRYGPLARSLLERGVPIGIEDTMIAAHALSLGLTLVTHNVRHFSRVRGLVVDDWY
jgi:tRNA(fMet)-specific endonuclease VapC